MSSYEHARKIVKGLAPPSKHTATLIANRLGKDAEELLRLSTLDRMEWRFGADAHVIMRSGAIHPELSGLEQTWDLLTNQQKELMSLIMSLLADYNLKTQIRPESHQNSHHPKSKRA